MQLRQRISIFATLEPLTQRETAGYIEHRLKVAGYESSTPLFTPEAVSLIAHYSDGIPRNINNICFHSISIGCVLGEKVIDAGVVRETIANLGLERSKFGELTDDLGSQEARFADSNEDIGLQRARFTDSNDDIGLQRARFADSTDDECLPKGRFANSADDLGSQDARFADSNDDIGLQRARFADSTDDEGLPEARFANPADDLGSQGARFTDSTDDTGSQGLRLAEQTDDLGRKRPRFAEPILLFETDEHEFEESDLSEQREVSPGLRVASIAFLLFAMSLAVVGWYVARSGGFSSPLMSQVTSWFHNFSPVKNQSQVQAPALPQTPALPQIPASPQVDRSSQTPIAQKDESAPSAATPSEGDSSLRTSVPSQSKPANDGTAQASRFFGVSKLNRERSGSKLRASSGAIPKGAVEVVGARKGQSFAGICVQRFNGCTLALLNTIVELNPGIKDQDHLQAGQRVYLPLIAPR